MSFWPADINDADLLPPSDIMRRAGDELENRISRFTVTIIENRLDDRVVLSFIVKHHDHPVELNLFEASHRLDNPYPAVIVPPVSDIPDFLKRKRYVPGSMPLHPGISAIAAAQRLFAEGKPGRYVENEWVCATPAEFREKLEELCGSDGVKAKLTSLMTDGSEQDETAEDSNGDEES